MPQIILSGKLHFLEVFFTKRPPPGADEQMSLLLHIEMFPLKYRRNGFRTYLSGNIFQLKLLLHSVRIKK